MLTDIKETDKRRSSSPDFYVVRLEDQAVSGKSFKPDDYYKIIFLAEGEGVHWIDEDRMTLSTPEYYFLEPGQLHRWRFTQGPRGFVLFFRASFYNDVKEMISTNLYHQVFRLTRLCLPKTHHTEILLHEIAREFERSSSFSVHVIHGLLRALYARLLQLARQDCRQETTPVSLYSRFSELIVSEGYKVHKVTEIAQMLHTTPQHLNTVCRECVGQSAGELIDHQVILEAKRLILHTDSPISEIAFFLSFQDASHFIKFFKRHAGMTPLQYRKQHFQ
jgi:AraC-like DNA-binding protein